MTATGQRTSNARAVDSTRSAAVDQPDGYTLHLIDGAVELLDQLEWHLGQVVFTSGDADVRAAEAVDGARVALQRILDRLRDANAPAG